MNSARDEIIRTPLPIEVSPALLGALDQHRGRIRALVVGGSVRDALLGHTPKDVDVEVYGTSYEELVRILEPHGRTDLAGRSFGVIKFRDQLGHEADVSIPRRESKTGVGHKGFAATFDPDITPREAAARRDFTINALAWDPFRAEVHDYFGGRADLSNRILRATSPAFAEDPLRVLRGMQFSARFGMAIDRGTADLCRSLADEYQYISQERVAEEWMKLATKGRHPGALWSYLRQTGWIALYPHLSRLVGVPQDPKWHPEGAVDVHVAHVMDAMARIVERENVAGEDRAVLMFAALTHDLAKSHVRDGGTTLQREKNGVMRWTAYGHEQAGGPMAREFLTGLGLTARIIGRIVPLVENHLQHVQLAASGPIGVPEVRRLADRLAPATLRELAWLIEADTSGRPPLPAGLPKQAAQILDIAARDGIADQTPPKLVQGRDVLRFYQNRPGPHIGAGVKAAYEAYLKGAFSNAEEGKAWLARALESKTRLVRGEDVLAYFEKPSPAVGELLRAAWEAQLAGEFSDREGAQAWLARHMERSGHTRRIE
jgi:tRNA nucleotidyltransferase (CCA-adding enzyme)